MSAIHTSESDAAERRRRGRLHVLVVEDHQDTAELMKRTLERDGFSVRTVGSHKAALETASVWLPDVLVCDVSLGSDDGLKDGWQVMRTMRDAYPTLKGVVVSGRCGQEDQARSLEAGFSAHLCKPVDGQQLAAAVLRLFEE